MKRTKVTILDPSTGEPLINEFQAILMPALWRKALKRYASTRNSSISHEVRTAVAEYMERKQISLT